MLGGGSVGFRVKMGQTDGVSMGLQIRTKPEKASIWWYGGESLIRSGYWFQAGLPHRERKYQLCISKEFCGYKSLP